MRLTVVEGDITEQHVDAIVNAANSGLAGGGGVDGAIHRAGGPIIALQCRALRQSQKYRRGLPTGQAVATSAGNLPARWVIHTVGPIYSDALDQVQLLRDCYINSLIVADELGAATVAFPLLSAGAYRWPRRDAVHQAIKTLRTAQTSVQQSTVVLFDQKTLQLAELIASGSSG